MECSPQDFPGTQKSGEAKQHVQDETWPRLLRTAFLLKHLNLGDRPEHGHESHEGRHAAGLAPLWEGTNVL